MTYSFLLLDLFLILIPIFLSFDKNVLDKAHFKFAMPAILVAGIIFSAITVVFTIFGVWGFNPLFLIGSYYRSVPIEQYLFLFAFSFAGLGVYNYLNIKFPNNHLQKFSLSVSNLMLGVCVAFIFFAYAKWYTVVTFSVLFVLLLYIEYLNKLRFMYRFYRAYVVCLIPFYICYGVLCYLPTLTYDTAETIKLKLGDIPLENHFYMMGMLLLTVYVFEFFKHKKSK